MSKSKESTDKIQCWSCHRSLVATNVNYYMNNNPLFKLERFPVCKDCIRDFVGNAEDPGFMDRFKLILALLNRPFLPEVFERRGGDWGNYLREIGSLHQHKTLTFADSEFLRSDNLPHIDEDDGEYSEEQLDSLIQYWGRGYTIEEYEYLENEKFKLLSSFECPDYGMEMIMRDICFINLQIEKLRQDQRPTSTKELTSLIETRSKLMNDANIKPIQATGAEANDQLSFGVFVRKWENERPIPQPMDDEMKKYIDTFMVGHLAKMEGLRNELTERYEREIAKYTISYDEIKKDDYDDEED